MAKDVVKTSEDSMTLDEGECEERRFIGIWVRGRGIRKRNAEGNSHSLKVSSPYINKT